MTEQELAEIRQRAEQATRKDIPGYPGYMADSNGHIWSVRSNWRGYGERVLSETLDNYGYCKVRLYRDGERVNKQVHHLVALAFFGKPKLGYEVRHLNGIRTDNQIDNLLWGTRLENALDRSEHGHTAVGSKNGSSKLCEDQVRTIKVLLGSGLSQRMIAKKFNVSQGTIGKIGRRESWRHVE